MKSNNLLIPLICVLLIFGSVKSAGSVINGLDPTLVRDLYLIECFQDDPSAENINRLQACNLSLEDDPELKVFLHFSDLPMGKPKDDIIQMGVRLYEHSWIPPVGANSTGFVLAKVRASRIKELVKTGLVRRVTAAYRKLQPLNDNTAEHTGAAIAWEQDPPVTGEGVRLAILDSGFQLEHEDLPEPAVTMDYADYPDTSEDVTDLRSGHGTHVAGTAFGSGHLSNRRWKGMAFDAEPIYLKIGDDSTSNASSAAVIGAIRGAATWCEADILTMSYGGSDGFNDGSSAEEQAVDWAVSQGVTVFMSAGNEVYLRRHYMAEVAAGATSEPIQIVVKYVNDPTYWGISMSWYDGPDTSVHDELTARIFDGNGEPIEYMEMDQVSSPRGTEAREYMPFEMMPRDSTSFFVEVINHSDNNCQFHMYTLSGHWYVRFRNPSPEYTVGLPSTADSCISVGAFLTRNRWTDQFGVEHFIDWDVIGEITYFSSWGPRIDGVLKPNITAPGQLTISCRDSANIDLGGSGDSLIISNDGEGGLPADYVAMMGTSMSSPAAAGTAALILQTRPDCSPSELREMIFLGARTDEFTGDVPNNTWGWGKIDFTGALSAPYGKHYMTVPVDLKLESVYPNPFNSGFKVRFNTSRTGIVHFLLYDVVGREVWSSSSFIPQPGVHYLTMPVEIQGISSGAYMLSVKNAYEQVYCPVTLVK